MPKIAGAQVVAVVVESIVQIRAVIEVDPFDLGIQLLKYLARKMAVVGSLRANTWHGHPFSTTTSIHSLPLLDRTQCVTKLDALPGLPESALARVASEDVAEKVELLPRAASAGWKRCHASMQFPPLQRPSC